MLARVLPLLTAAALLCFATPAMADQFNVTATTTVGGTCTGGPPNWDCTTLRAAIDAANANDTEDDIFLQAPGTYDIDNTLTLSDSVGIFGLGARQTQIDGGEELRVIDVLSGITVTLGNLTIQNGNASGGDGGNIRNAGELSLFSARVTGGEANVGGGLANEPGGTVNVFASLIDLNAAPNGGGISTSGGSLADPNPSEVDIEASTIALNTATTGGGILATGGRTVVEVNASTIAKNFGGIAITNAQADEVDISGSLIAANTGGGNCAGTNKPIDEGFNLEDANSCNLNVGSGSKINTDPGLSAQLVNAGGGTNVFTFAASSPAVDMVAPCTFPFDQRFFQRVTDFNQPCDAGAYEQSATGPAQPTIESGPSGPTTATSASFSFSSLADGDTFVCQLIGPGHAGGYAPCTSPVTYSGLAPGTYVFSVAIADVTGQTPSSTPTVRTFSVASPAAQTPTPTPTPTPTATPVPQQDATGKVVSGKVLIKVGGKFVPLDPGKAIPSGSEIDVTKGKIELTAILKPGGKPEKATFYDGIFKLTLGKKTTDLTLSQPLAPCKRGASAAAKKPKTRKLWGDGSGSFRTRGQYSAATVRGTKWLVQDSCAGTLTKVAKGVVSVTDNVKHKTFLLKAGKQYLAKPRR